MRRTLSLAVLLGLIIPALCQAQQRFGTTGGGISPLGGSSFGGSSATAGSSGMFGSRSLGNSLTAGNRGFAGGGTAVGGGQGLRPGQTLQGDAGAGQVQGNERFTRQGRQAGQFVGSDTADLPGFLTELATGGFNSGLQQRNRGQQGQRQGQNANQQAGRTSMGRAGQQRVNYRIARSVGFEYTLPPPAQLQTQLGARLQALPGVKAMGPIEVTLQQRTAVLRGSVATAHDRDLAERLALLEAGVDRVQNELTIAPLPAAPTPAAAGN